MHDETEELRRARLAELNNEAAAKAILEARHGQVWTITQIRDDFEVLGFMAPYMVVRRKSDGKKGSLEFQHSPRYYFNWQAD